ncbi:MAG: PolC-type DNA polymerase III [Clostridiales bacterium]|nr:PolC-type DNA polymerase III [Clostridiales bacterium]
MSEKTSIPLLKLFPRLSVRGRLLAAARECTISSATIHQARRSVELAVAFRSPQSPDIQRALERAILSAYDLSDVLLQTTVVEPQPQEEAPLPPEIGIEAPLPEAPPEEVVPPPPDDSFAPVEVPEMDAFPAEYPVESNSASHQFQAAERPAAPTREEKLRKALAARPAVAKAGKKAKRTESAAAPSGSLLYGKGIRGNVIPMSDLSLDLGTVCVSGRIFQDNSRQLKNRNAWIVSFDMTDETNSVTVSKFLEQKQAEPLMEALKKTPWVTVEGKLSLSHYSGDIELSPYAIAPAQPPEPREDTAPEKRCELHLHTRFSTMDGLTDVKAVIKQAIKWGHKAIAITDHGVAHAFPDAHNAAGGKIKILYGVEAYYVNDVDDRVVVHGDSTASLLDEIVCFDLETTGLSAQRDTITEIGAVKIKNGQIIEEYDTFVNPGRPIPREVVELTSITDDMVRDAPSQAEAVSAFLDWVGDRPMAAHNADFDMGFLHMACQRMGRELNNTSIDTLVLAQNLLPQLSKFKLDIVAKALNLPEFHHHRACDDGRMVGYMLPPFYDMLKDKGVERIDQINGAMRSLRKIGKRKQKPRHLIVLAKNQSGLRNLYKLISLSHLEHYAYKRPIMPKSLIDENREGLIIGSACEAGELFQAVVAHKDWNELKRIASWYDFLEIQPICNNRFMIAAGTAKDDEALRDFNRTILRLAKELDKPCCATGDVHFLNPEDEIFRHILLNANGFSDADKELPIYFKTTDEMLEEFAYLGEEDCRKVVIDDPDRIQRMCDTFPPLPHGLYAPSLKDSDKELEYLVYKKAHELYGENLPQIVQDRIDLELPGIIQRNYDVIYMSAQKLVKNSLDHGYLVGSRGSVGSSIVAFLSGITEVNALKPHYRCPNCKYSDFTVDEEVYGCGADLPDKNCPVCGTPLDKDGFNIPFETFLGYGGTKVPDIDLNFSGEYQAKAHRYTYELFGKNHVFKAGTVGTVADKTAYGYVLKYMEQRGKNASHAEMQRLANGCVNIKRTTGQHPGGMVVIPGDQEIYDFCPVQHPADDPNSDMITTHFEYHSMESNLLKLDMLGHDDPTMIRMLQDETGIDPTKIPLDDQDTMSIFCSSRVLGYEDDPILGPTGACAIPEFGTGFTRQMLIDTQPKNFSTLLRLSGFSHGTDVWLGNAKDLITSGTATVTQAIGCRDDIMLYLISKGIDPLRSFKMMEAVRKGVIHKGKSWPEGIEEEMRAHDVPEWYIESCRKIKYLFPKGHAVAYVMMAFRIAWFKVHRPLAFYAAYFSVRAKAVDATCMFLGKEKVLEKMNELKAKEKPTDVEEKELVTLEVCYEFYLRGFQFLKMDLTKCQATRYVVDWEENALMPPFCSIPGLGESAATATVEAIAARNGAPFISIEEVESTCNKLSATHLEQLKYMGALDGLPDTSQLTLF